MQEKSKFLSVRLTAEEREHLDRLARESGLSLSNVIRSCINRTEIRQRQPAIYVGLENVMRSAGFELTQQNTLKNGACRKSAAPSHC